MKHLNVFYDIDDTLVKSLNLFFFADNLLAFEYLKKIKKERNQIHYDEVLNNLPSSYLFNKSLRNCLNNHPEEIKQEINQFKKHLRDADDKVMEEWPRLGRNPFSQRGYKSAIETIVDKYYLNLSNKELDLISRIPYHYALEKNSPLDSITYLLKESLEHDVNLYIFSKGSFLEQSKKLEYLKLNEVIPLENLYILHKKDRDTIEEIINQRKLTNVVVIGNSLKEEILPAKELEEQGVEPLWVEHHDYFSRGIDLKDNTIPKYSIQTFQDLIRKYLYD